MVSEIKFYFSLFFRRLHYFLFIFLVIASVGATLAYTLPPIYRAEARLLVESPQIPDDLAASTVRAGASELLHIIEQRLLTRANLLEIARRFDIYRGRPEIGADDIVQDMRGRIAINLPNPADSTGIVFVSFEAASAVVSAQVTNELVTQILRQNVELRTSASGQTLEFFEQEVDRLNDELSQLGGRILEFKLANKDALPESLNYRRARQAALQERILQINREFSALSDRRARLQELFEQTGRVDLTEESLSPEQRQLREIQNQLASAMVIYSPQNPRVRTLVAQVEALEGVVAKQIAEGAEGQSVVVTAYELQIADIDGQISYLAEQKGVVEQELVGLSTSINATPENAITLGALERDYENVRQQFNDATSGLAEARTGDRIEALSKGQRIVVIEQAIEPNQPARPNRKLMIAASIGSGILAGAGFVFLLELLNRSIRRPVELGNNLNIKPFAVFPYIKTRRQTIRRRLTIGLALLSVGIGLPLGLYMLHIYYLPMDMLVQLVLEKTGIQTMVEQVAKAVGLGG